MLDKDSILNEHEQVINLLEEGRLKEALVLMASMNESSSDYQLKQELQDMQTSYHFMLQYMEQGIGDPGRETLYKELMNKAFNIADLTKLSMLDEVSNTYYHTIRKRLKKHPMPLNMTSILNILESYNDSISLYQLTNDEPKLMEDMRIHESALKDLFTLTWTNSKWTHADRDIAYKYLSSELISAKDLSLLVSAVTLSLTICFDIEKVFWLMEAFYHKDPIVRARAQVGFVMIVCEQPDRTILYPGINTRLSMIQEEKPDFTSDMNAVIMQLIRSQATERISKTMQEEIVPEVMKNIQQKTQHPSLDENEEMDMNPDWLFDLGPKLNNKMSKIAELQQEGGDINMVSFSRLKSFTFFNEIHNWFLPFDTMHSEVIKTLGIHPEGENKLQMNFLQMGMFCDSDNYSMIMVMQQMPPDKRKLAFSRLKNEQVEEMMQEANIENYTMRTSSLEVIRRFYIQDLYRFYKLSPFKTNFVNIFDQYLYLNDMEPLRPLLHRPEFIRKVADVCFKTENYTEAFQAYEDLDQMQVADSDVYQRMGYCCEIKMGKTHALDSAIDYYEKALIIKPGNKWTLKRLATCYRNIGQANKELACYLELVQLEPANLNFIYKLARVLMEQEKYEEALQHFYQLDLTKEDNLKAWRGIAWCSFALGKLEQARKYCDKALAIKPNGNDWLNAGHIAWCQGDFKRALLCYRQANSLSDDFRGLYLTDLEMMVNKGFSKTELQLMLEII